MYHPYPDDRVLAVERAKKYVDQDPLFLDTETTGLTDRDEICEIAVIDVAGNVLINSLVKPAKKQHWHAAAEIHGITPELVQDALTFKDLLPPLDQILRGRTVLVYNAEFDEGKLMSSALANDIDEFDFAPWWFPYGDQKRSTWHCAMNLYATYHGDWNEYHSSYRWVRLGEAAKQCGIVLPAGIHRAHADAELARLVVLHLAAQEKNAQLELFEEENSNE